MDRQRLVTCNGIID